MSEITLHVDKHYVDESKRGDPGYCMVANAFREQLDLTAKQGIEVAPSFDDAGDWRIRVYNADGEEFSYELPVEVYTKIEGWDSGINPEPFSFTIDFPEDWRVRLNGGE